MKNQCKFIFYIDKVLLICVAMYKNKQLFDKINHSLCKLVVYAISATFCRFFSSASKFLSPNHGRQISAYRPKLRTQPELTSRARQRNVQQKINLIIIIYQIQTIIGKNLSIIISCLFTNICCKYCLSCIIFELKNKNKNFTLKKHLVGTW